MDRKSQLKNVAFGGAWSEQIAGNEARRFCFSAESIRRGQSYNVHGLRR